MSKAKSQKPRQTKENGREWQVSGDLDAKQEAVLAAMLAGQTIRDAAQTAGVGETTVYRWKREHPAFTEELERRTNEVAGHALDSMKRLTVKAALTIGAVLDDAAAPINVKLRAAELVLKFHEQADLNRRVEALELSERNQANAKK